jgi:membrane-bound ClpP family serine protease
VNPWLITTVVLVITVFLLFVIHKVVTAHRHQPTTGSEDLKGKEVPVHTALQPHGTVLYEGEIWKAFLDEGTAEPGETVVITGWQGLTLFVTKDNKGGS